MRAPVASGSVRNGGGGGGFAELGEALAAAGEAGGECLSSAPALLSCRRQEWGKGQAPGLARRSPFGRETARLGLGTPRSHALPLSRGGERAWPRRDSSSPTVW